MRFISGIFLFSAALIGATQAATLEELATKLPACGLLCLGNAIAQSSCTLANSTCICSDTVLLASAATCLATSCTVREQLEVAKIQEEGCGVPVVSKQLKLKIITYVFCILAEVCIILRLWTKLQVMNRLSSDDWVMVVAGIATIPFCYLVITGCDLGLGLNMWDTNLDTLSHFFKLFLIEEIVYLFLLGLTKIAILLFLVRIFPSRSFRIACWTIGCFTAAVALSFVMATLFSCRPISFFWIKWEGTNTGICNDINAQTYIAGAINIAQDFTILILPMPEVYKLQVSLRKKVQLFFMFSVGLFVSVISIIRLRYLVVYGNTTNPTKDYVDLVAWSVIEPMLAIVCACLPSVRQLLGHVFPKGFGSSAKQSSGGISRNTDPRIYQSRSFKMESKLRSQTDDFHELDSITNVTGTDVSSDHHTPGNLNNRSTPDDDDPALCRPGDEESGPHVWTRSGSIHESISPLKTKF